MSRAPVTTYPAPAMAPPANACAMRATVAGREFPLRSHLSLLRAGVAAFRFGPQSLDQRPQNILFGPPTVY